MRKVLTSLLIGLAGLLAACGNLGQRASEQAPLNPALATPLSGSLWWATGMKGTSRRCPASWGHG